MIYLINMPFSSTIQPSLALSQFKAQLAEAGIESRLLNLNFELARRIGFKSYEAIARRRGVDTQVGEWLFARHAWDDEVNMPARDFMGLCGAHIDQIPERSDPLDWLQQVRDEVVPRYLDDCTERLFADGPPTAVAFSCVFYQTISALALARWVKKRSPSVKTVFGGACFHDEMGEELVAKTPWVDIVATGEADEVIVELMRCIQDGKSPEGLPGIVAANGSREIVGGLPPRPASSEILEGIPNPDYDDFLKDLQAAGYMRLKGAQQRIFLPFESSRGCWWGQKSQCSFCGLNAGGMQYRYKSPERVAEQLRALAERYPLRRFFGTDNNFPYQYYDTLLKDLARNPIKGKPVLFYEIKTNIRRDWIRSLAEARVNYIQPGVETLSTAILKLMRKGVRAITNVHLLKLCRTYMVLPMWNFLAGIPGERSADYAAMAELIPKIIHYFPPYSGVRVMQLHRYSPYFNEGEHYVEDVRPRAWYAGLFPKDRVDLSKVAYYFDARWKDVIGRAEEDYQVVGDPIRRWIEAWRQEEVLPGLTYDVMNWQGMEMVDTRNGGHGTWRLNEREAALYKLIDDPATVDDIHAKSGGRLGGSASIKACLNDFVASNLAIEEDGLYLGLALPNTTPALSLKYRLTFLRHDEDNIRDEIE